MSEIREIHVAFSSVDFSYLETFLYERGAYENFKDYRVLQFHHHLTYGDVSDIPLSIETVLVHKFTSKEEANKRNEYFENILQQVPLDTNIKLWVDFNTPDEYLNLCYFANLFAKFKHVELVRMDYRAKRVDGKVKVKEYLQSAERINLADLQGYSRQWEIAKGENKAIRYVKNGEIYSVEADFFDEIILRCITPKFRAFNGIYSKAYKEVERRLGVFLDYNTFEEIMIRLVEKGVVVPRVPFGWNEGDFMFIDNGYKSL